MQNLFRVSDSSSQSSFFVNIRDGCMHYVRLPEAETLISHYFWQLFACELLLLSKNGKHCAGYCI